MSLRNISLRDRDEAGEPGFRGQKIVVGSVEASWTLHVREPEPDGKDPALAVVEEGEVHAVGQRLRAAGERAAADTPSLGGAVLVPPAHEAEERVSPENRFRGIGLLHGA